MSKKQGKNNTGFNSLNRKGNNMYSTINFKTKKQLKEAVKSGKEIGVYQPGGLFPAQQNGSVCIEGPHYPQPHTWYATCKIENGAIKSVK